MSYVPPIAELEKFVVSCAMAKPGLTRILPLNASHFATGHARDCWRVLSELADFETLDFLTFEAAAKEIHGPGWDSLRTFVDSYFLYSQLEMGNVHQHAAAVLEHAERRQLLFDTASLLERANRSEMPTDELRNSLTELGARASGSSRRAYTAHEIFQDVIHELESDRPPVETVTTGVPALDERLGGGFRVGVVNVVAARAGSGKSTLVMQSAFECASRGIGAHVFSLEDHRNVLVQRAISKGTKVPVWQIMRGQLDKGQGTRVSGASTVFTKQLPLLISDVRFGAMSVVDVIANFRANQQRFNSRVCIVDYLGMLRYQGTTRERHLQVGEQVQALVDFAARDEIAVVLVAQLNRNMADRRDPRPQLTDLKESGSIEEKAKVVVALHRGHALGLEPKQGIDYVGEPPSEAEWKQMAQLCVLKNSLGIAGPIRVTFNGQIASIS